MARQSARGDKGKIDRMISVMIGVPEAAMIEAFEELRQRAGANVFLHPAALCAAAVLSFAQIHVLMAWLEGPAGRKLVGFWALRERRVAPFWRYLATPPYDYAFMSSPVIDPQYRDAVWPAFFDAIARERKLPNVMKLKLLDADDPSHAPMIAALQARRGQMITLAEQPRPFLNAPSERKRSGSTGKKLRQDWNRLSALGHVDIANDRSGEGARGAFEVFLAMEFRSWKGANGTALLSRDEDAAFTRRLIAELSARGCASVALLRVDGRAIAAQVLLYSGTMAYTWKTAFDTEFAKFSPGAMLVDKVSDELFASGIETIESCSTGGGFMEQLWTGRRATADLLIDVGGQKSLTFAATAFAERAYTAARQVRNRLRALRPPAPPERKMPAAAPG
jgi:CelD/BcsL family acetyltransferase involved in cellulose biosynthesis